MKLLSRGVMVSAMLFFWVFAHTAKAADFNVIDTASLLGALTSARNNNEDDTIHLAPTTYNVTGAQLTYNPAPNENRNLTILGESSATTILEITNPNNPTPILFIDTRTAFSDANTTIRLSGLTFRNSNSNNLSAATVIGNNASITVEDCRFLNNHLGDQANAAGGGLFIATGTGNLILRNSIFAGNSSQVQGGGAGIAIDSGTITVIHNTFTHNQARLFQGEAAAGGGIFLSALNNDTQIFVINNIIFGNRDDSNAVDDIFVFDNGDADLIGNPTLFSNNDFSKLGSKCSQNQACASNLTLTNNLDVDPMFVDINQEDIRLKMDSPLIDQGLSNPTTGIPAFDFAGDSRPAGAAPDIGADEHGCGNGSTEPEIGEACDDVNMVNTDSCTNNCKSASCGDGFPQPSADEACDDGNQSNTDACLNTCSMASCGDGFVQIGVEACDDGNQTNGDNCDNNCTTTACGNGIITEGEACDDSNTSNNDGCSSTCMNEISDGCSLTSGSSPFSILTWLFALLGVGFYRLKRRS